MPPLPLFTWLAFRSQNARHFKTHSIPSAVRDGRRSWCTKIYLAPINKSGCSGHFFLFLNRFSTSVMSEASGTTLEPRQRLCSASCCLCVCRYVIPVLVEVSDEPIQDVVTLMNYSTLQLCWHWLILHSRVGYCPIIAIDQIRLV